MRLVFAWPAPWEQRLIVEERSVEVHGDQRARSPTDRRQVVMRTTSVDDGLHVELSGGGAPAVMRVTPDGRAVSVESEDPAAAAAANELWNLLVGWWAGRQLEVGEGLEADATADSPGGLGGRVTLWLRSWERCPGKKSEAWCVRLELVIRADPGTTAALAREFAAEYLEAVAAGGADLGEVELEVGAVRAEVQYEVLAHPDTLRPVWATRRQWHRMAVAVEGEPREFVAESVRETRWTFPAGPAGAPVLQPAQKLDSSAESAQ